MVLKSQTFKKYVSVDSPFRSSDWEKIKINIYMELGFVNASSQLKQHVVNLLQVKEVSKGSVLLQ